MSKSDSVYVDCLSHALRALRLSVPLSIAELSGFIDVAEVKIKDFEKGKDSLSEDEVKRMSRFLESQRHSKLPTSNNENHELLQKRIVKQNEAMRFLSKHDAINQGDLKNAIELICETAAKTMQNEFTGVWLLNDKRDFLEAIDEYVLSRNSHEPEDHYNKDQFPEWFKSFNGQRNVITDSTINNYEDDEFDEEREKWGIEATIETNIFFEGEIVGIIANEDNKPRQWHGDEISFHTQLSDLVSRVLTNKKSRELSQQLNDQRERVSKQQHLVMDIIRHPAVVAGDIDKAFDYICINVSRLLQSSVSIGLIDKASNVLVTRSAYDHNGQGLLPKKQCYDLPLADVPVYKNALINDRFITASNVNDDPRYAELAHIEMIDKNIISSVDAGVREGGELVGVLTVDSYVQKSWHSDEQTFIGEVTEQISQCLANQKSRQAEHQLYRLSRAVESSTSALVVVNDALAVIYGNSKAQELLDRQGVSLVGLSLRDIAVSKDSASEHFHLLNAIAKKKNWRGELELMSKDGESRWLLATLSPMNSKADTVNEFVLVCDDVSELKAAHKEMERMAFYDSLTGLVNRRLYKERLSQSILSAQRYQTELAVLFLDLDRFKLINDTLGHEVGDQLLKEVASCLESCVGEGDTVARLGGDEFTILLNDVAGRDAVIETAKKIIAAVRSPIVIGQETISVTTSIGISLFPENCEEGSQLMKMADMAMYNAKTKGRNSFDFYHKNLDIFSKERLGLEHDLRQALDNKEFIIHYQPIINSKTQRITSVEALIRWQHPSKGLIQPLDFIPIAEDIGIINDIGAWVLLKACTDLKAMQQLQPQLKMSVNLAASQFNAVNFVEKIAEALLAAEVSGESLILEITESMLIQDIEHSVEVLHNIRAQGVSISIDDFGTGYSSLGYLKRLPIDNIKIDKTFVEHIHTDKHDCDLTTAVIDMAHSLKLNVIAEGVEQQAQEDILSQHGCEYYQGFLYAHPCGVDDMNSLLQGRIEGELSINPGNVSNL
ncbi:EAL domain-containing protein [Dasania sp. GY-MA-18]|uniref:cyclic-guanylate-specific phosphodiesterase n=1 Tax=Dasania phycosphaerae TaxID=2950436 RepID=A0A9J6RMH9_9GAMM|nr:MULTISPECIES: EAL domain-containing protein [Dasania]MCR8923138.1 EAL domain-containing protein [Dasania sp. GY-MA-18]MCZ0865570.1 EAL domain-containing protein [Dasania phycosphaerae]MCZ0869295.1 EAL domain-containing protein [Dasania phycosphaerae]